MPGLVPGIHVFYRPCDQDVDGRNKSGHDGKSAMHDIKWIRDNPDAFDAALERRGLEPLSSSLLAIDEKRRAAIKASEQALARRNSASKACGLSRIHLMSCMTNIPASWPHLFRPSTS